MQSLRWGNDGRPHCIHLWVPCAALLESDKWIPPGIRSQEVHEITYKICIRPDCRKVLT